MNSIEFSGIQANSEEFKRILAGRSSEFEGIQVNFYKFLGEPEQI